MPSSVYLWCTNKDNDNDNGKDKIYLYTTFTRTGKLTKTWPFFVEAEWKHFESWLYLRGHETKHIALSCAIGDLMKELSSA